MFGDVWFDLWSMDTGYVFVVYGVCCGMACNVLYEVPHVYVARTFDVCAVCYIYSMSDKDVKNNLYMEKYLLYKRSDLII
jgi:hypothetical protein